MNKKEVIFKIIGQLKRTEKRLFRLEMEKFKSSSTYILIYDYLERSTELDDKAFKAFCQQHNIRHLSSHILHLHAKLIRFLVRNKEIAAEDNINKTIKAKRAEAHIYMDYSMPGQAAKTLKKACEIAYKHNKYYSMLYVFPELMKVSRIAHKYPRYLNDLSIPGGSPVEQMQWIIDKISGISINRVILQDIVSTYNEAFPSPERDVRLKKLQQYQPISYTPGDAIEFACYYNVIIFQAYTANDIVKLISLIEDLLAQLPNFFIPDTTQPIALYVTHYFTLCQELFSQDVEHFKIQQQQYKRTIEGLIKEYKLPVSSHLSLHIETYASCLKQYASLLTSSFDSTIIKSFISSDKTAKSPILLPIFMIQLAVANLQFVMIRDYSKSNECYRKIQSIPRKLYQEKIFHDEIELIEMIKSFELNDRVYLANIIKAIRSKHYTNYYVSPINKLIVKLINKMQKASADKHLELMKAALPELQKLEKTIVLKYVPFSYWLKWRIKEYE